MTLRWPQLLLKIELKSFQKARWRRLTCWVWPCRSWCGRSRAFPRGPRPSNPPSGWSAPPSDISYPSWAESMASGRFWPSAQSLRWRGKVALSQTQNRSLLAIFGNTALQKVIATSSSLVLIVFGKHYDSVWRSCCYFKAFYQTLEKGSGSFCLFVD